MMRRRKMYYISRYLFILIMIFISCLSCTKKAIISERGRADENTAADPLSYEMEGFITNNVFRVVIVEPRGVPARDIKAIQGIGERRAHCSMRKYLMENGGADARNADAILLNLISEHGKLKDSPDKFETRIVYFFDVEKPDLKVYLNGVARAK